MSGLRLRRKGLASIWVPASTRILPMWVMLELVLSVMHGAPLALLTFRHCPV